MILGRPHQALTGTVIEPGIGREPNFFFLNRGVHVHPGQLMALYRLELQSGADGLLQQFFGTGIADSFSPAGHAGGIHRHPMLEHLHPAEVLPVGVLDPTGHHALIAEVVRVLQVVKRNHQSSADRWPTGVRAVTRSEGIVERCPVYCGRQLDQTVGWINDPFQFYSEQIPLSVFYRSSLGFHGRYLQENGLDFTESLQKT
jgi:hypothetical protein